MAARRPFFQTLTTNGPLAILQKEPGWSVISIHAYTRGSIEWRYSFYHYCAYSKNLNFVFAICNFYLHLSLCYSIPEITFSVLANSLLLSKILYIDVFL